MMCKFLSSVALSFFVVFSLSACSTPQISEQEQTNEIEQYNKQYSSDNESEQYNEQYSSDNGNQQRQCNRSFVRQVNGKTEIYQSSKCE